MADSDSTHFSEQFSYKILCISSYSLKDINFARFDKLQEFSENRNEAGTFRTKTDLARVADRRDQGKTGRADWALGCWHRTG
jgi:hypothetical protein